jgi:hypothetical protein
MKIRLFSLLAVLLFSVNIIEAKEKQPLKAKETAESVKKQSIKDVLDSAEKKKFVSVVDTTKTVTVTLPLSIDVSTPIALFTSLGALLMAIFQIITGYFTKANDWLTRIVPSTTWRVSVIPLLAALVSLVFFKFSQPAITLFVAQLFAILAGQNAYDKFLKSK